MAYNEANPYCLGHLFANANGFLGGSGTERSPSTSVPARPVSAFQWGKAVWLQVAQAFPCEGKKLVDILITELEQ